LASYSFSGRPIAYRRLTVSTNVVNLSTAASPITATSTGIAAGPVAALISVQSNGVRCAVGEDPTASNGFPLAAGDSLADVAVGSDLRFIRSGGADATLEVLYYG
jgi:hypothetical protein